MRETTQGECSFLTYRSGLTLKIKKLTELGLGDIASELVKLGKIPSEERG